jgi:hypothetical protein
MDLFAEQGTPTALHERESESSGRYTSREEA